VPEDDKNNVQESKFYTFILSQKYVTSEKGKFIISTLQKKNHKASF